jgi:hypothetical protein
MRKLLLVVTGCIIVAALVIFLISRRDRPPPQPRFADRASQVLAAWRQAAAYDDFAYDYDRRRPRLLDAPLLRRPGVVPDDTAGIMVKDEIPMPAGTADPNYHLFEDRPPDGTVRLPDGTALRVPVIRATDAEEAINEYAHQACTYKPQSCVTLPITRVRLDTAVLRGSPGPVTVPVWRFSTAQTPDALAWVAVGIDADPPVLRPQPSPDLPPWPPDGWWYTPVSRVAVSSTDAAIAGSAPAATTRLVVTVSVSACGSPPPVTPVVYEAADAVVLSALGPPAAWDNCGDPPMWRTAVSFPVRLAAALGNRVILDGATGSPVPLEVTG